MNKYIRSPHYSRRAVLKSGLLTVGFALAGFKVPSAIAQAATPRVLEATEVDAFLELKADGSVTLYSGKVDLGQGLRVGMRQIVAEELGVPFGRIDMIDGDTALTPNQGRTAGSAGIEIGGMQIRKAAATARAGLIALASKRLGVAAGDLTVADGEVRPKGGGAGVTFAALLAGNHFDLKLDDKAPLKDPAAYTIVGKFVPHPDVPAKVTGRYTYVHDIKVPGMLHGRIIRPPAIGAELIAVDEASIASLPGAKVVRIKNFLAVVDEDEWTCVRAMRALKARWTDWNGLPAQEGLAASLRAGPFVGEETLVQKGESSSAAPPDAIASKASYFWPNQSHASLGPSCAVADVKPDSATIWTASQGTHGNQTSFARFLGLPKDKVRLIYVEGSGCYGMNGHEDAAADAAILSRAVGRPLRLQWMRHDEHGWDPKGPPQLLDLAATIDREGRVLSWTTEAFIPQSTRGPPNIPFVGPAHAGIEQPAGIATGRIDQNLDPPYAAKSINVVAHWLKETPLRSAPLRAPGKPGNCFAIESFVDELASAAKLDPVAMRLKSISDPRGIEAIKRAAAMMRWEPRVSPLPSAAEPVARGRGFSYIHYKQTDAYVAMGMEVAVDRGNGRIAVERVVCVHDCGQIVAPDGVRSQVEGSILQTLSRVLMEEVKFDRARVTSVDWNSYPILHFSQVPRLEIELIDRPFEKPVGAGEAACAPVAAALGNAVFDATGVRLRAVPFTPERVKAALDGRST